MSVILTDGLCEDLKMKIYYFDFVAKGGVHTTFNSAMIEVLNKVYPDNDGIILHSEKEHGKIVKEKCTTEIELKSRKLVDKIKYRKIKDLLNSIAIFFYILFANNKNIFFVGLAFPFSVNSIYFFSKLFNKRLFLCLHGELQYLLDCDVSIFDKKSKRYFSKMKFAFSHHNKDLSYVVLGKTIYESAKHLFNSKNKVIVLNHPAIFKENKSKHEFHKPIVIAQIGQALKRKGSKHLFELANLLKDEIKNGNVVLKILGICGDEFPEKKSELVRYSLKFLSEEELSDQIEQIDFSIQLTTDSTCTAIASGTLIDSLIYEKPVLGLMSSYLDYYTEGLQKKLVCSSIEELANLIKTLLQSCSQDEYKKYVEATIDMKKYFSVEYNAELFRNELGKWKYMRQF